MIPKFTQPLVKSFRTGEGILVYAITIALGVGTTLDSQALPPKEAAIVASGLAAVHAVSRTFLKFQAVQYEAGVEGPATVDVPAAIRTEISKLGLSDDFNAAVDLGHEALNHAAQVSDKVQALEATVQALPVPASVEDVEKAVEAKINPVLAQVAPMTARIESLIKLAGSHSEALGAVDEKATNALATGQSAQKRLDSLLAAVNKESA